MQPVALCPARADQPPQVEPKSTSSEWVGKQVKALHSAAKEGGVLGCLAELVKNVVLLCLRLSIVGSSFADTLQTRWDELDVEPILLQKDKEIAAYKQRNALLENAANVVRQQYALLNGHAQQLAQHMQFMAQQQRIVLTPVPVPAQQSYAPSADMPVYGPQPPASGSGSAPPIHGSFPAAQWTPDSFQANRSTAYRLVPGIDRRPNAVDTQEQENPPESQL